MWGHIQSRRGGERKLQFPAPAGPYCVIPFLLPPPKNPYPARAEEASQAGLRRFDPGRPVLEAKQLGPVDRETATPSLSAPH